MNNQALNFVVNENGIEVITTAQAIKKFRKKLFKKAKQHLRLIKDSINFILVSELEKASEDDFEGYIEKSFDGSITKDGINGVNNLMKLVKTVAVERGITEPCIAYVNAGGRRLLVTKKHGDVLFLNAEVKFYSDYEADTYSDKGDTPFGWGHPTITVFYERGLEEYDYNYELVTKKLIRGKCCCGRAASFDDPEICEGCYFYDMITDSSIVGRDVIYVKAI